MRSFFIEKLAVLRLKLSCPSMGKGFLIPSHLTAKEKVLLYELAKNPKVDIVLEIGSYLGASAYFLAAGLSGKTGIRLFCIDTWNNDAMSEGARDTFSTFKGNTRRFSSLILPMRGQSVSVVEEVARQTNSVDLLFIDGDHSYPGVKADWDAYKRFLRPGSVVVFHDSGWAEGVKRVIKEEVEPLIRKSESLPNMWWGEVGVKP